MLKTNKITWIFNAKRHFSKPEKCAIKQYEGQISTIHTITSITKHCFAQIYKAQSSVNFCQ